MIKYENDIEWLKPKKSLSRKEKAKNTRIRKKHYKLIKEIKQEMIDKCYPKHSKHLYIIDDIKYKNNIFERELILCDCKEVLEITKKMIKENYGRAFILSAE